MAIVFLKRDWFDHNGVLWQARNNPHEILDEGALEFLPSDAVVDGVSRSDKPKTKAEKAEAKDLKETGEQALAEKKREEKIVQEAESEHNDIRHAAVETKTAKPSKL